MQAASPQNKLELLVELRGKLHAYREGIAEFLDGVIRENRGFPARSFYGESFSYWLLSSSDGCFRESLETLISSYAEKDKASQNFHWEFNNYAWISILKNHENPKIQEFAFPLHFNRTPITNWVLLRCCTQILANYKVDQALRDARNVLHRFQKRSGLIYDDCGVRSFQYHCFSSVLVAEISKICDDVELKRRFIKSVEFINNFILKTGDTLFIGRGQQQSFGYGALIYQLALACFLKQDFRLILQLEKCISFLSSFQRQDGSFPLVMNDFERGFPIQADPSDPHFPGWYAYNNYFDYLPFLGIMLLKAEKILSTIIDENLAFVDDHSSDYNVVGRYQDDDFLVVRNSGYELVLARPGGYWKGWGYWTNDLPMPYIVCKGKRITPSFGGEQYGRSLYGTMGIPLPLVSVGNKFASVRDGRTWSFWLGNTLIVITFRAILIRVFYFESEQVVIKSRLFSPFKMFHYYLFENVRVIEQGREFLINQNTRFISDRTLHIEDQNQYFWGGEIIALRSKETSMTNTVTISLEAVV